MEDEDEALLPRKSPGTAVQLVAVVDPQKRSTRVPLFFGAGRAPSTSMSEGVVGIVRIDAENVKAAEAKGLQRVPIDDPG